MDVRERFYLGGQLGPPGASDTIGVVDPTTEEVDRDHPEWHG